MKNTFRLLIACLFIFIMTAALASTTPIKPKPTSAEIHKILTPLQYNVTQESSTEEPYKNAYWNNHEAGIYVDVVSGEPLFSSLEKYESGTGWPSFYKPLTKDNIVERQERSFIFALSTEVRSKHGDSHLGHVFNDGPKPSGLRYCINSAALKFIPVAELQAKGYGEFLPLFKKTNSASAQPQTIVFAGGCFWGVQAVFSHVKGVISATSGYAGGTLKNPTYDNVSSGITGHAESVQVNFNPSKVTLEQLLNVFFKVAHDPTQLNRQGPDVGSQYRSAIFYTSEDQKMIIDNFIKQLTKTKAIVTQVKALEIFYPAESYHQNYAKNHPQDPYICTNDKPKVENLRQQFPELWTEAN